MPKKGEEVANSSDPLRRLPRQGRAERARGGTQRRRRQRVVLRGKPRAGEADQHAAFVDPFVQALEVLLVDHAAVAHDDGVDRRIEEVGELLLGQLRIRLQRLAHIIVFGQQRLRLIARIGQPDMRTARRVIPQPDAASRRRPCDPEARDAVQRRCRNGEQRFGRRRARAKVSRVEAIEAPSAVSAMMSAVAPGTPARARRRRERPRRTSPPR